MNFNIIDKETWHRKEYFDHFYCNTPCTYSMTVKLDITKIVNSGKKLYPTMLYSITKVVNKHSEFRMAFENGQLGFFEEMLPCYTIFHKETKTFSNIWTQYFEDYNKFLQEYNNDIATYGNVEKMIAKPHLPKNNFPVSMIPWTTFEGFNLNLQNGYNYLLPIFTLGKFYQENQKFMLPLAIQVHHAVCDGFHLSNFINELQDLLSL